MHRRHFLQTGARSAAALSLLANPPVLAQALDANDPWSLDMALVRGAMDLHPGALRYMDAPELARGLDGFEDAYRNAGGLADRFLTLSRFLASLHCGHTHCNFYNQSDAVAAELFDRPTRLPFLFEWIDRAMVVTADLTGEATLPVGTVIESIDGTPTPALLERLLPLARADGGNDAKRIAQLEVRGGERYPAFDIFQGLLHPPRGGQFLLGTVGPSGNPREVTVAAISPDRRPAAAPPPAFDGSPLWTLDMRDDGVAFLSMPTWVVYRGGWDWAGWLVEQAPALYAARGLVIDLRGNEGGLSCGDPILARLAAHDIPLDDFESRVRFRRIPDWMDAHVATPDQSFRTLGVDAVPLGGGFFGEDPATREKSVIEAETPRLTTPTAVLVDASNSSASFLFALRAKRHGLATLVGETTGGNLNGINAGAVAFVTLPGSGIEFDVPLVGYFPDTPRPDRGVLPDIAVSRSAADIAAGRDPVLDAGVSAVLRS